jgi:hypothetical protein
VLPAAGLFTGFYAVAIVVAALSEAPVQPWQGYAADALLVLLLLRLEANRCVADPPAPHGAIEATGCLDRTWSPPSWPRGAASSSRPTRRSP